MPPQADVPLGLSRIVDRCLRKDPSERPQSALELASMLAPFAGDSSRSMMPRIRAWSPANGGASGSRSQRLRLIGGLALMALSGAVAFELATLRAPAPAPSAPVRSAPQAEPLEPIPSPPAPTPVVSASAPPAPSSAPGAPPAAASQRPKVTTEAPKKGRIQDLDGIELLQ